mmetsp:Transcript_26558/g.47709  ORF Transcript_26558/g.47709 Transcript_26558/m.47709 type:complete len:611 (+) Transcript_26558:3-1835(+)
MEDDEVEAYKLLYSEKISELEALQEQYDTHMESCEGEKNELQEKLKAAAADKEKLAKKVVKLKEILEEAEELKTKLEEAEELKNEYDELHEAYEDLKNKYEAKEAESEEFTHGFKALYETIEPLKIEIETLKSAAKNAVENAEELKKLREAHESLEEEAKEAVEALVSAQREVESLKTTLNETEAKLAEESSKHAEELGKLSEESARLVGAQEEFQSIKQELEGQVEKLKGEVQDLIAKRDEFEVIVKGLTDNKEKDTETIADLTEQFRAATAELEKLKDKENFQFEEFQKELYSVKRTNGELESENTKLNKDIEVLNQDIAAKLAEMEGLRTEAANTAVVESLREELDEKQREIERLMQDIESIKANAAPNETDNPSLRDANLKLEESAATIGELHNEVQTLADTNDQLQSMLQEAVERVKSLQEEIKALTAHHANEVGKLIAELDEAKREVEQRVMDSMRAELSRENEEENYVHAPQANGGDSRGLKEQVSLLETAIEFKDTQISDLESKVSALRDELQETRLSLQTLEASRDAKIQSDIVSATEPSSAKDIFGFSPIQHKYSDSADASIAFSVADGKSASEIVEELIGLVSYNLREHRKALQLQSVS